MSEVISSQSEPTETDRRLPVANEPSLSPRGDLVLHAIDDEAVLYDVARDSVYFLNATSAFVWNRLGELDRESELTRNAIGAFSNDDVSEETVVVGVREAIAMFRREGLLDGDSA